MGTFGARGTALDALRTVGTWNEVLGGGGCWVGDKPDVGDLVTARGLEVALRFVP